MFLPLPIIFICVTIIPYQALHHHVLGSWPSVTWFPHTLTDIPSQIQDWFQTQAIKRSRLRKFPNHVL